MVTTKDTHQLNGLASISTGQFQKATPEGLKACLQKDRESTLLWVDEAPLRLVAAALVDARRRTTSADLKTTLTAEIIKPQDWKKWWDVVRFGLGESRNFSYNSGKRIIRLHRTSNLAEAYSDSLDDIREAFRKSQSRSNASRESSEPTPSISGLGGWILWVQADEEEPLPRSAPVDDFIKFLRRLPESIVPTAIIRLLSGIEQRLINSKQRPADKPIDMWQQALVAVLNRWSELSYSPDVSTKSIIALTARVLDVLGSAEFEDVVKWIATYSSKSAGNAEVVSDALLLASYETPNGTDILLGRLSKALDVSTRVALWQRLISMGLRQANKPPLEQWVRILEQDDRSDIFPNLLTTVFDDGSIARVGALLTSEWKSADSKQRHRIFDSVALAWVLHRRAIPDTKAAMIDAVSIDDGEWREDESLLSEWRNMALSLSDSEVQRVRDHSEQHITRLKQQLEGTESELIRLQKQVKFLQGENSSKRSGAEFDISRDAITVLGMALQDIATSITPKSQEVSDLESKIILALSTLGAKPCGDVGDVVPFDPVLHEANSQPVRGASVKIVAPGLRYTRLADTPINLMKILVQ